MSSQQQSNSLNLRCTKARTQGKDARRNLRCTKGTRLYATWTDYIVDQVIVILGHDCNCCIQIRMGMFTIVKTKGSQVQSTVLLVSETDCTCLLDVEANH